jgi:hypothetical protein
MRIQILIGLQFARVIIVRILVITRIGHSLSQEIKAAYPQLMSRCRNESA